MHEVIYVLGALGVMGMVLLLVVAAALFGKVDGPRVCKRRHTIRTWGMEPSGDASIVRCRAEPQDEIGTLEKP